MGNEESKSDWWLDLPIAWTLIGTNWFLAWPTVGIWYWILGYQKDWDDFFYRDTCAAMSPSGSEFIDWFQDNAMFWMACEKCEVSRF